MTTRTHPRRRQLTAAVAAAGLLALTACGGDGDADAQDQDFGELNVPLSWLHTAEFAGLYMAADNGYFEEAGFESVNLVRAAPLPRRHRSRSPPDRAQWACPTRWWWARPSPRRARTPR